MDYQPRLNALATVVLLLAATSQGQITLNPSSSVPSGASPTVNPAFAAYAFEERSFYSYSGYALSQNLIAQAANRTNSRPIIRVGGNSLNTATYVSDPSTSIIIPASQVNHSIPTGLTLGPAFWSSFKNFPTAQYIVDLPMNNFGGGSNLTTTTTMAQDAWNTIGSNNILAFELGNEPNSYSNYAISDYATQFQQYSAAVSKAIGVSSTSPMYLVGGMSYPDNGNWTAQDMFPAGLNSVASRVRSFAAHYYQLQNRQSVTLQNLLSHKNVVSRVSPFVAQIKYLSGLNPPIPFDFGETACSVGQIQDPSYILQRSLGAALWQIDFLLYTMTLGASRVHIQSGYGFEFSLFQPAAFTPASNFPEPAAVYANYYAHLFVGDFIGRSGKMQAVQLDTGAANNDTLVAYAAYEAGTVKRVAVVNMAFWNGSDPNAAARPSQNMTIAVPAGVVPTGGNVTVRTLSAALGSTEVDTDAITWAGMKYTLVNDGLAQSVGPREVVLPVNSAGQVTVNVPASQAVMLFFGSSSDGASSGNSSSSSGISASASTATKTTTTAKTTLATSTTKTATHKSGSTKTASASKRAVGGVLLGAGVWGVFNA